MTRDKEYQMPDPALRKRVTAAIVGVLVVLAALRIFALPVFENWADTVETGTVVVFLQVVMGVVCVGLAFFAAYFVRLGKKVRHAQRFPLPGARVIKKTLIRTGSEARRLGLVLVVTGTSLIITTLMMWVLFHMLVQSLVEGGA